MLIKNKRCTMDFTEFNTIIVAVFVWAYTTLALDGKVLGLLVFLLAIDALTGFIKGIVLKKATSRSLIVGLSKKLLIVLIPITIASAAIISGQDITWFISMVYSILALGEAYSILANIIAINTKKEIEEFDALSVIANSLSALIKKYIK